MKPQNFLVRLIPSINFVVFCASCFIIPLLFDRGVLNTFLVTKQYALIIFLATLMLLSIGRMVLSKEIEFRQSVLDKAIGILAVISVASTMFSLSVRDSIVGRPDYFTLSLAMTLVFIGFYFMGVQLINTPRRWQLILDSFLYGNGLCSFIYILVTKGIWSTILAPLVPLVSVINTSVTSLAFMSAVTIIISSGQLIRTKLGWLRRSLYCCVAISAAVALVWFNIIFIWWLVFVGLLIQIIIGISFVRYIRHGWLSILFAGLLLTSITIFFGLPQDWSKAVVADPQLNLNQSWVITSPAIFSSAKNALLGSGPGTFIMVFSQFRDSTFNNDNNSWWQRFDHPSNSILALLTEGGVLTLLIYFFIILVAFGYATSYFAHAKTNLRQSEFNLLVTGDYIPATESLPVFLVATSWIVATIGLSFHFFTTTAWWSWWLLLVLVITGFSHIRRGIITDHVQSVEETPEKNVGFYFTLVTMVTGLILLIILVNRFYWAEKAYASALRTGQFSEAETKLKQAIAYRPALDIYHSAYAQINLLEAVRISENKAANAEKVAALVSSAVAAARQASELSPQLASVWENLATMYENAAVLAPEARDWAIKSLQEAQSLDKTNPNILVRLGGNYVEQKKWIEAKQQYSAAIALKKDFSLAYIGLAKSYEAQSDIDQAIVVLSYALSSVPSDPETLFNLGRLLYGRNNKNDRALAESYWLKAIQINPNFSSVLGSLAALFEAKGDKNTALNYYRRAAVVEPENTTIAEKITLLQNILKK